MGPVTLKSLPYLSFKNAFLISPPLKSHIGEGVSQSLSRDGFPVVNHFVVSDSRSCEHEISVFSTSGSANLPDQGCAGLTTRGHPLLQNRVFPPQKGKVIVPYGHQDAAPFGARTKADLQCSASPSSAPVRYENGITGARASNVACGYAFGSPDPCDMANGGRYMGSQENRKATVKETVWFSAIR